METLSAEGSIKPIDRSAVHRICSGQVVLDLATAVKELVENSLDAGATSIDIRLKDHGAELIEVADNGSGVSPENYQGLTLKYHTSKISKFADLAFLSSFGFRGEALSSLCSLSNVTVVTRTKDEPVAVRLEYDHAGLIVSQENVARAVGTTVTVGKLFSPLPVRFKEFRRENNIRREYGRLLSVLQGYALISKGVRLLCSNQTGRAGRTVVVQTQGNSSLRDNLVTVFGSKTASSMEWLDLSISDSCSIEGFVSKPGAGCGRPSGDRQFFYVNGRPVDMPKVSKLLNELYRSFNSLQFPMLVLNFILPTTAYDVNVTPDKRKLFLHSEGDLMVALRESLEKVYAPSKYTYPLNNLDSNPPSGSTSAVAKKLVVCIKKPDGPAESDLSKDASTDDENHLDVMEGNSAGKTKVARETEYCLSPKPPLNLLFFQYKTGMRSVDKRKDGEAKIASMSPGHSGKSHLNASSGGKVQASLAAYVSQKKRPIEDRGTLLSEEPLLKQWKSPNLTEKSNAMGCESDEPVVNNSIQNSLEVAEESCDEAFESEDNQEPSQIHTNMDNSCTHEVKLPGSRMFPCSSAGPSSRLPGVLSLNDVIRKEVSDIECNKFRQQSDSINVEQNKCVQTSKRGNGKEQTARTAASIRVAAKVDNVRTSSEELNAGQEREIIEFDMKNLQKKFNLGLLLGQMTKNSDQKHKILRRSCNFEWLCKGRGGEGGSTGCCNQGT